MKALIEENTLKHFAYLISLVVLSVTVASAAADRGAAIKQHYAAQRIAGDTYVIHGPLAIPNPENQGFMNNPAIIVSSEGLVIIDPGSTVQAGEMVIAEARKISDKPIVATFSTHIHGDHWLGNQAIREAYPEARLYAHPEMIAEAKAGEAQVWVDRLLSLTRGASAGTVAVIPDLPVDDGDVIKIGNKTFSITHRGIAHTKTDIMIRVLEDDVYFLGDNSPNKRMGRIDDGSFTGLLATLDVALEANAAHYVPGHGPSGDRSIVVSYRGLISSIYEGARRYYDEGLSDFEMKPKIIETLGEWQSWGDFDEAIGRFISLAVLEAEQHAFDQGS